MCFLNLPLRFSKLQVDDLRSASRVSAALSLIFFQMNSILVESVSKQSRDVGLELTMLVEILGGVVWELSLESVGIGGGAILPNASFF